VGLAYPGGARHLVYYDSKTDRVHDAGDLKVLTGEALLQRAPQSKMVQLAALAPRRDARERTGWLSIPRPATWKTSASAFPISINTGNYDSLFNGQAHGGEAQPIASGTAKAHARIPEGDRKMARISSAGVFPISRYPSETGLTQGASQRVLRM
jgi:hypothetical protein